MTLGRFSILVLAALMLGTPLTTAATVEQVAKLLASDGREKDAFGYSVAVEGDTAVIGMRAISDFGTAYVFTRSGDTWTERQKLVGSGGPAADWFGSALALDGDTLAVGAPKDEDTGQSLGSVYVFTRSCDRWSLEQVIRSGEPWNRWFGYDVFIDGDTLVVGAPLDHENGEHSGSAYVYTRTDGVWTLEQKLLADDGEAWAWFGRSVALDGERLAIGAVLDDATDVDSGSAYVFTRSDGVWVQRQKLLPDEGARRAHFGGSVALENGTLIIASDNERNINNSSHGSAYVFARSDGGWARQQKLQYGNRFGIGLALDSDTVVVGAPRDYQNGFGAGAAHVFARFGEVWVQQAKLLPDDGETYDGFGFSVSLDGDTVVVGARGDDDNGDYSGSAYVLTIIRDPLELLAGLRERLGSLDLLIGIERSLAAKLEAATRMLERDSNRTTGSLHAFIHEVEAQRGRHIAEDDADALVLAARNIIALLAGGG